jgi:F0F1-type ATP synthase membrane subunit b/b'
MRKVDDIMGNTVKDDVIVLAGREFKRVKSGLDEAQVVPFIDELVRERDKLAKSQDHIVSLNRLAEMAVVEADKLAAQIKTEAAEQAKAESAAIIDKAKEQARQMSEKKIAEAVRIASEQANVIKAKAEEEAVLLLENQKNKIRGELRNLVNQQFGYMLEELESLKQQAAAVQADFGNKLSEPKQENSTVTAGIAEERDAAAEEITKESDTTVAEIIEKRDAAAAEIAKESDTIVAEIAEKIDAGATEIAKENDTIVVEASKKTHDEYVKPGLATDNTRESSELSKLLEIEEQPELGKPQWEVEILPPFDISKIMEVVSFLDRLPEVANTEMIVPQIDVPSILVFLRKTINFVDVLKTIPAVAYVEEVTPKTAAANGRPRKVRISLSKNIKPQGR